MALEPVSRKAQVEAEKAKQPTAWGFKQSLRTQVEVNEEKAAY